MKKNYFLCAAILVLTLFIISCNNENNENQKNSNNINCYEEMGELHNVYAARMFSDLQKRINTRSTLDESISLVNAMSSILQSDKEILEENQASDIEMGQALNNTSSYILDVIVIRSIKEENLKISDYLIRIDLSTSELSFINRLDSIISNDDFTINQITELENQYINNVTEKERNVIEVTSAIARNSVEYWRKNASEWFTTFAPVNTKAMTRGWFSGRSLCKADIAGGISGAVGGAIVGSMAGGAGAGPGAAAGGVGGAAAGSVADAVFQVINHFWPEIVTLPGDILKTKKISTEELDEYSMQVTFKDPDYGVISGKELRIILTDKVEDLLK